MPDPLDVIMPAYNAERWIAEAARSVLALPSVRSLTIADDGSAEPITPESAGADADPRVTVLRRANGGEAAARNTAIDHLLARTDASDDDRSWVMFFDSDDLLLPSCLDALADAERHGCGACVGAREAFAPDGRTERLDPPDDLRDTRLPTAHDAFRYKQVFASTGMTVRRSILRSGERWDELIHTCPDIELLHRFALRTPVWVSTKTMLRYRTHDDGANLSGSRHLARRALGFVRTVELHACPANDALLREQARWLINQLSKHAQDAAAFDALVRLHTARGWPLHLKPVIRHRVRCAIGRVR
jgi:glycosyltransferase involved in cell wall biosynthesis